MKVRKIFVLLFALLFAFVLPACNGEKKETLPDSVEITVDGEVTEEAYFAIPEKVTGVKGAVTVRYAADKTGIYFGITVKDESLEISKSGGLLQSDYVGLCVDVKADPDKNDGISESTHLFRFDITGRYTYSVADDYGNWQELFADKADSLPGTETPEYALKVEVNEGYSAEIYYTWEQLGTTAEAMEEQNRIMYYIEHRDYNVDIKADANILSPSGYNRLVLLGDRKGSNLPLLPPEITIDGIMDEEEWETATVTNEGNFSELFPGETAGDFIAKAFFGKNGVYFGVFVEEPELWAPYGPGPAYKNCGMEFRIHVFDKDGMPLAAYKWLFDLHGPQWHETVAGGLASSFAPYAEYKYHIVGTVNDDSDTDTSWGFEMYVPYEHLNISDPDTDYLKLLNAVGSFEQHNALPESYRNNPANQDNSGAVSWDFPENYPVVKK